MVTRRKPLTERIEQDRISVRTHLAMLQELVNAGDWKASAVMNQEIWWMLRGLQRDESELVELEDE